MTEIESESLPSTTVCAGLWTPLNIPLDVILFIQFVHQITEVEAREEIWSSVNYLFFITTSLIYEKNWQGRQGIV